MPAVYLSPFMGAGAQFFDNNGAVLNGGKLHTYLAGTTTNEPTYTDNAGGTENANPIILSSAGRLPNPIWGVRANTFKFVLKTSADVTLVTWDQMPGVLTPDSPGLTGTPTAPTAAVDTATTQLATTAYVVNQGYAKLASPVFTGNPTAPTPTTGDNDTSIATTAFAMGMTSPGFLGVPTAPTAAVDVATTQLATTAYVVNQGYAKLAGPALTGVPTAPTAAVDVATTQLATCAFVINQTYAKLASPTFTGTPTLPTGTIATTQNSQDNSTNIATTAYVQSWSSMFIQSEPNTYTAAQTLTAGDLINHLVIGNNASVTMNFTLPTVTTLEASLTNPLTNSSVEFTVLNIGADTVTIVTNTGWTLVGSMLVGVVTSAIGPKRFRGRKTGAGAWTLYAV